MEQKSGLRRHLVQLLSGRQAHLSSDDILRGIPYPLQGKKIEQISHTLWQLLEHIRIAQWDILEFSLNPEHVSPKFPEEYWPAELGPPDESAWDQSLNGFENDLERLTNLIIDSERNLLAPIAHGQGQTFLREVLLVADHNAYHLGQMVVLRQLLGCWQPDRQIDI